MIVTDHVANIFLTMLFDSDATFHPQLKTMHLYRNILEVLYQDYISLPIPANFKRVFYSKDISSSVQ